MKQIPLSKFGPNAGKYVALVDDEDYEYLNQFNWRACRDNHTCYARRTIRKEGGGRSELKMHQDIMQAKGIDHIDHDGLNNQRSNLRLCTISQNGMNMRPMKNKSSKYKGVSWKSRDKRWEAKVKMGTNIFHLGYFKKEEDAASAYNKKAAELFGEWACLNIIE